MQSGAGAVPRSIQAKLGESVTPLDFGVSGDGTTNDSSAFSALETAHKGKTVDLLGKTYLVTAVPNGAHYINGSFRVGATLYPMPRSPLAHPLDGPAVVVTEGKKEHAWIGPVGQPTNDDILITTRIVGWRHEVSAGAPLICELSYDEGVTWQDVRTVYSNSLYEPRGPVGGMVTGTRYGVYFLLVSAGGGAAGMRFAYTDDNGVNWTIVTPSGTDFFPHGEFVFDDAGGVNVFGYGGGGGFSNIYRARSTDNGASWVVTLAKAGTEPIAMAVEPTVVKVSAGKYLMFVRDDNGGNLHASVSSDLSTWGAWVDTSIANGTNPPLAIAAWGRIWLYLCGRRSTPINGWEDKLLVAELDGDAVFSAGGALSNPALRICYTGKTAMIGYLTVATLRNGRRIGYLVDGETLTGSANPASSRRVRLGGHTPAAAAPALLLTRRTQPPITHNATFGHWTRGTSFTGISTTTPTADRWQIARSITNVDVTRQVITDQIRKILPCASNYYLKLIGDSSGSGRFFIQKFEGRDRIAPMLDRVVTMNCLLNGTLPGYFIARVVLNFGTGGSTTKTVDMNCLQTALVGDLTRLTATLYTPNADGATWGADPYIQFILIANGIGAADANLFALWWDYADGYVPLDPIDYDDERYTLDRYCQKLSYGSLDWVGLAKGSGTANVEIDIRFPQMVTQPVITADAANNLQIGTTALSAISFDLLSPQSARMVGTLSSGILAGNNVGVCSVVSGGSWSLLADVRF